MVVVKSHSLSEVHMKSALIVLGNQLFDPSLIKTKFADTKNLKVFLKEDTELCTYYKFHKHKIIFFLAAMRSYAEELKNANFNVHYEFLSKSKQTYEENLLSFLKENKINHVNIFEIEDKFFEKRLFDFFNKNKIQYKILRTHLFLTSRNDFSKYLEKTKKPFMKTFYENQRKSFNILVDADKKPIGGKWSFDEENRKPLPKTVHPPELKLIKPTQIVNDVKLVCDKHFKDHPGDSENFWLPVNRDQAKKWLKDFLTEKLINFGPYEDAIPVRSDFVFHSVLTPFLNTGLLTPEEVVKETLLFAKKNKVSIQSVEGFIRQIIGWREFIRGIYQNFSDQQENTNFWNHQGILTDHWYTGTTGIPPLDNVIKKTIKYGYAHHIERLMIVGSLMLLLEVHPQQAHRWFMEMFIDSSDWVMGPNVYGMALFSDGGIFATKPYFCGSNYYRKMGGYKKDEWCEAVDGLYWQFIEKHKTFFLKNHRLSMMVKTVEKMDPKRKSFIYGEANKLRSRLTKLK